jgi:hypothetical protein
MSSVSTSALKPGGWYPALCLRGIQCDAPVVLPARLNFTSSPDGAETEGHFHDELYARIEMVKERRIHFTIQYCKSCNPKGNRVFVSRLSFVAEEAFCQVDPQTQKMFNSSVTEGCSPLLPPLCAMIIEYVGTEDLILHKMLGLFRAATGPFGSPADGVVLSSAALKMGSVSLTEGTNRSRHGEAQVAETARKFALIRRGQLLCSGKAPQRSVFCDLLEVISSLTLSQ